MTHINQHQPRERSILYRGSMVSALLAGIKTQTRRVCKPAIALSVVIPVQDPNERGQRPPYYSPGWFGDEDGELQFFCPYGKPGDHLRVKEAAWMWCERRPNGKTETGRDKWLYAPMREAQVHYAADHPAKPAVGIVSPDTGNQWGWRLKIGRFLPAWASRITLEVTGVRVERLQDISEADARAEGLVPVSEGADRTWTADGTAASEYETAIEAYRHLWEQINGLGSFDENPLVWVVSFKVVQP